MNRRGVRLNPFPTWFFACAAMILAETLSADGQSVTRQPTSPRPDDGPRVVSSAKAEEQGKTKSSRFLVPPGSDRYDSSDVDWRDVPPWRQTTFFGVRAKGQFFVYVVDCSGSMVDEDRLARAKEEVRRSVLNLREPQRFKVIFYNDGPIPMPGDLPRPADLYSKNQLLAWLRLIEPDGGTDPKGAVSLALAMHPDAVFLLSDGEFPPGTADALARKNPRKVPIHCIDLSNENVGDQLKRIASASGGRYVLRPQAAR